MCGGSAVHKYHRLLYSVGVSGERGKDYVIRDKEKRRTLRECNLERKEKEKEKAE